MRRVCVRRRACNRCNIQSETQISPGGRALRAGWVATWSVPRHGQSSFVDPLPVCVFITAVPITKLFAWGGGEQLRTCERHVLRETTSLGLCGLVCSSRTSERGEEGYCVKEGGGEEGERVCFLLQYLLQSCSRGGSGKQWRTCARLRESVCVCLLLQYLLQSCSRGVGDGTREEPGTLTQGGVLFSLVPLVCV
jgi:hypothetical protein